MTSQTKYLIDFSDILALAFKCRTCGGSVSMPISSYAKENKLKTCPSCDEPWLEGSAVETYDKLRATLRGIAEEMKRKEGSKGGFTLAIEVFPAT